MRQLVAFCALALSCHISAAGNDMLRDGDLIFQTSRSSQSMIIQRATRSKYSHMGMIFLRRGKPFVYEAAGTVRYTALEQWIARGDGGRFVVKRLRHAGRILDDAGLAKLRGAAVKFEGKPYDPTFEWSDNRIYCSELVWKIYRNATGTEIGRPQRLGDFALDDPAVRHMLKQRYGIHVPLNEPMISPAAMFDSPLLVTVTER